MRTKPLTRSSVLDVLRQLIAVPSVNPTLAPHEGQGEGNIATFVNNWFASKGVRSWSDEVAPKRFNAVAQLGEGQGAALVFCAHLDTVSTDGMSIPPFEARCEGNRVYGRGSYDMKGGAAAIMSAMAALALDPPRGKVFAALVADEEYASIGAQHFVAHYKADACVLTEPSEGSLILCHKGFVWAEIETRGRAAHGSRWDLGVSAIGKMGKIVTALEDFDRQQLRRRVHPQVGPASQHSSLIAGGSGLSTYAESCTLKVERRTLPSDSRIARGCFVHRRESENPSAARPAPADLLARRKHRVMPAHCCHFDARQTAAGSGRELLDGCGAICGSRDGHNRLWTDRRRSA